MQSDDTIETPLVPDDIAAWVRHHLCVARPGDPLNLVRDEDRKPEVVIKDLLFRFPMVTEDWEPVTLSVFANPGRLGMQFWRQEVRTLLRLGGLEHPALPRFRDGGERTSNVPGARIREVAYVLTDHPTSNLADPERAAEIRRDPVAFMTSLARLADALLALHTDGLLHRNIQPRNILIDEARGGQLRLGGFEMSALQANLLRRGVETTDDAIAAAAGRSFVNQGPAALACVPPERLIYLFTPKDAYRMPEAAVGDVYALGVIAFICFVGELDLALLGDAFPAVAQEAAEREFSYSGAGWHALHEWMIAAVREAPIGATLRALLQRMLAREPDERPRTWELVRELTTARQRVFTELGHQASQQPYLVAVEPQGFKIIQDWGWISGQPLSSPAGQSELLAFLREDLKGAWLEHAPQELARNIRSIVTDEIRATEFVLRGRRGSYYGQLYENRQGAPAGLPVLPHVFMARWTLPREAVGASEAQMAGAPLPALRIVPRTATLISPRTIAEYPSWAALLEQVRNTDHRPRRHQEFAGALHWLLAYKRVASEARKYPFVRDGEPDALRTVALRFDAARDSDWRLRNPLRNVYTLNRDRRPAFGDFFGAGEDREFDGWVRWRADAGGAPRQDSSYCRGEVAWVEPDRIGVRVEEGDVPDFGWIEPYDDSGQESAFERESRAVDDLLARRTLVEALLAPRALVLARDVWRDAASAFTVHRALRAASPAETIEHAALAGERSKEVLQRMLGAEPVYVLQGPPGTGKTTVTARAVRAALMADTSLRILISAQSHYSLDNLAAEIRRTMPDDPEPVAVRLASSSSEAKVGEAVQDWTRKELLKQRPAVVAQAVEGFLTQNGPNLEPARRAIVEEWLAAIRGARIEIVDRTRDGANLVFATCLQAAETGQARIDRPPPFDWVIVEEAAKALPTELAIPLVRGARWSLIGDHKQLSAYKLREIRDFLTECVGRPADEGLGPLVTGAEHFPAYFELFAHAFTDDSPALHILSDASGGVTRPVDSLNRQFRMRAPIGDVVRDAFYPGALDTGERPTRVSRSTIPPQFSDRRLIWLNTDDEDEMVGYGQDCAGEVTVVRHLLAELWPQGRPTSRDLAILSPYRRQRDRLERWLDPRFRSLVHTVDSFQGREADVVIVSLVRGYSQRQKVGVYPRIGHLADEPRTNVLISRAREYLVLVGRFTHFLDTGRSVNAGEPGAFWRTICERVREWGTVIKTDQWFGPYREAD